MKSRFVLIPVVGLAMLAGAAGIAQGPTRDVSHRRHPNLAAAQQLVSQAFDKIAAAQRANEFDMGGHAQRAKDLLDQADRELKQAAEDANRR